MARLRTADNLPLEVVLSFGKGEHHVAHATRVPEGYARSVTNYDVDDAGVLRTRPGAAARIAEGGHSMYTAPNNDTYFVSNDRLAKFSGGLVLPIVDIYGRQVQLAPDIRVWWEEYNGTIYYSNGQQTGSIDPAGRWRPWGIPNPVARVEVEGAAVASMVSWIDDRGEESGAVRCDEGIDLLVNLGYRRKVYRATADGELFRDDSGVPVSTAGLLPFPPAIYIAAYNGFLVGAIDSLLVHSEPMRPGLYNPAHNFVELGAPITAVVPVEDGIYVSTERAVFFLTGIGTPDQMAVSKVSDAGAFAGSQARIPLALLDTQRIDAGSLSQQRGDAGAWLSSVGPVIALPGGAVKTPAASAVRIMPPDRAHSAVVLRDGFAQLVVAVDSTPRESAGAAVDSLV